LGITRQSVYRLLKEQPVQSLSWRARSPEDWVETLYLRVPYLRFCRVL
jgi:hypothetical protein